MSRKHRVALIVAIFGLVVALSAWANAEQPEWIGVRYLITGFVAHSGATCDPGLRCVEWCDVYQGVSSPIPRRILCCVDPSKVGNSTPDDGSACVFRPDPDPGG